MAAIVIFSICLLFISWHVMRRVSVALYIHLSGSNDSIRAPKLRRILQAGKDSGQISSSFATSDPVLFCCVFCSSHNQGFQLLSQVCNASRRIVL